MSNLTRWDPGRDMVSLRDMMDRLFEDSFVRPHLGMGQMTGDMAVDVYETKDEVVLKVALPGVKPEEVDLSITGDMLSIRGETREEHETKEGSYIRRERHVGSFARSIELPAGLQTDKADASFENGVLTLKIPKSEQVKPKSIKVRAR